MSYQVLARKWRPQRFDDVIGQRGTTETLRNAIVTGRIGHSFVFSGPRGVGKTTTARILARGLNCEQGPTADPCGVCDACVEIAQGRDIDVLEIDAATNTQVQNVRDVIVSGLGMAPARDRYKIFIIDEVHRLSQNAFDALLKSIEEPPSHVVFMMATTEVEKVPQTIRSRSQVFELKTIGVKAIADQLRRIADAEQIEVDDAAIMLVARAGDGSMRDAQSALDQVIAFAGRSITADDVTVVLGLVRRDVLLDMADAVASEDAAAVFELAGRSVESGYDLRLVIRELARLTRDLLVVSIDPSRAADPEIAADGERERLVEIARKFSAEDLMRAFDVLTKAEYDIRASTQPRYHLEMALLRWIHLRRLVPLADLIEGLDRGGAGMPRKPAPASTASAPSAAPRAPATTAASVRAVEARAAEIAQERQAAPAPARAAAVPSGAPAQSLAGAELKEAFLGEVQKSKKYFFGTVVAQARLEFQDDRVVFSFGPHQAALRQQFEQMRGWLEDLAARLSGRRIPVTAAQLAGDGPRMAQVPRDAAAGETPDRQAVLKQQALSNTGVQAMLDVFGTEIIKEVKER